MKQLLEKTHICVICLLTPNLILPSPCDNQHWSPLYAPYIPSLLIPSVASPSRSLSPVNSLPSYCLTSPLSHDTSKSIGPSQRNAYMANFLPPSPTCFYSPASLHQTPVVLANHIPSVAWRRRQEADRRSYRVCPLPNHLKQPSSFISETPL